MKVNPKIKSRRERALAQRQRELSVWKDGNVSEKEKLFSRCRNEYGMSVDQKIISCEAEIANLKQKLGVS